MIKIMWVFELNFMILQSNFLGPIFKLYILTTQFDFSGQILIQISAYIFVRSPYNGIDIDRNRKRG